MKHLISCLFFLTLFLCHSEARAQFWQSLNGPPGAGESLVAVNSNGDIFVLVWDILERSTDDGQSWTRIELPIVGFPFWDIKAPAQNMLFALIIPYYDDFSQYGLWRSLDNGSTWAQVKKMRATHMSIIPGGAILAFEYPPRIEETEHNYSISTDNGNTWKDDSAAVEGPITNLWGDKAGTLFLSTIYALYRSTDNGDSWSKIVNGLPFGGYNSFAQAPNGNLFVAGDAIFTKSIDEGRTWSSDSLVRSGFADIKIGPNGRMYCGGAVSDDFGKTFHSTGLISVPKIDSTTGVFYFDENMTIYSSALGPNDTLRKITVPNSTVIALLSHPDGSIISFTKDTTSDIGYIWRSMDNGIHWEQVNSNINSAILALDSSFDILAAVAGYIMRSTNSGISWTKNSSNLTIGTITAIAVDGLGEIFATSSSEGVFRSTDHGVTWDQFNKGLTDQALFSLAIHQNGDIFVGSKNAVYHSTNQGINWTLLNTNFPPKANNVSKMVVSSQGNIIVAIDNIGIWWSTDNGASWGQRADGFAGTKVNSLISTPSGKVFVASDSGVFYLDVTPGISWVPYNDGIVVKNTLSLCRDKSGRLYCGTMENGVYSSIQTFNIANFSDVNQSAGTISASLATSYPNPVKTTAIIPFTLCERSHVIIEIVDVLGRAINLLASSDYESGSYSVNFDASEVSGGMYFIRMQTGKQIFIKPVIVGK